MVGCSVPAMVILALIQLVITKSSDFPSSSDTALESVCRQLDFSASVSAKLEVIWMSGMVFEELVLKRSINLSFECRMSKLPELLSFSVSSTFLSL